MSIWVKTDSFFRGKEGRYLNEVCCTFCAPGICLNTLFNWIEEQRDRPWWYSNCWYMDIIPPTHKTTLTFSATSMRSCSVSLDSGIDKFSENSLLSRRETGNWTAEAMKQKVERMVVAYTFKWQKCWKSLLFKQSWTHSAHLGWV